MKRCLRAGKHLSRYPPWALDKPSGREATAANLRRQGHAPAILDARCAKKPRPSKEDRRGFKYTWRQAVGGKADTFLHQRYIQL